MPDRFHPRPRGAAFAELTIFTAIVAFLAAIILPGLHKSPMQAKAAEVVRELRTTASLASANEENRADDEVADGQVVLLSYPAR
jgi:Tfp pilus assembly protein FimT